jgi:type I restriction enzyme S subunit
VKAIPRVPIVECLKAGYRPKAPDGDDEVWCLNLDQVESHSGKVLDRLRVQFDELGPSTHPFECGTVLYSKLRPYLNKVVVADEDGVATTELVPLRCDDSRVNAAYLAHFLRGPEFLSFATNVVSGAKMPRMVMSEFWKYSVPLPPLPEQRRIAAILDQADALRAKRREALAQLDSLTQSIFIEMFGDATQFVSLPLVDLCELITDGTHQTPTYADAGVTFLSAKNVTSGYIDWKNIKFIPQSLHVELHRRLAPKLGDVLLAKNGTTGVAALVDRDCTFDIYVSLALLRPKSDVLAAYLLGAINSPICKKQFNDSLKGIGVPNLHLKEIRATKIPMPPLTVQQTFATRIQAVESLKTTHRAALAELDALFASLQHRAFAGQLS